MMPLVWVVALLVVGLAVMVLEVFVPSGGVLGFLSVVAVGAAVVMAFAEGGATVGLGVLAAVVAAVPVVLGVAFRIFPETPLGRRVLPPPPTPDDVLPEADHRRRLRALVGRRGRAASELVPWGTVEIDGGTHEARSEGGPIEPAVAVEVAAVDGGALVVRAIAAGPAPAAESPAPPAAAPRPPRSTTLEEFDFDRLDPPAA
jgi:membrane-bound ClpP family serine protease